MVNLGKLTLRTLQYKGQRIAIKMEDIFWEQLNDFARGEKLSLTKFVHELVAEIDKSQNRTSYLRVYCMERLRQDWLSGAGKKDKFSLVAVLMACHEPAFALTNERKIALYNPTFARQILNIGSGEENNSSPAPPLQLTFSQPFNKVRAFLIENPSKVLGGQIGFVRGATFQQRKVRFVLASGQDQDTILIVVFVEPQAVTVGS